MTDSNLPWMIFNRKMRPFSFALCLSTALITYATLTGVTVGELLDGTSGKLLDGTSGKIIGGVGIIAVLLLLFGYWFRSDRSMVSGLLLSTGVWMSVTTVLALDIGFFAVSTLSAGCWAIAAGGAWLLEVSHNPKTRRVT
jgi:hypothetical protein